MFETANRFNLRLQISIVNSHLGKFYDNYCHLHEGLCLFQCRVCHPALGEYQAKKENRVHILLSIDDEPI